MEPYGSRTEAERWLVIAEKLLTSRDLLGSKTFAIRARESDPRLEPADRILAVIDTLLAGDKRINNQRDWYAILQLVCHTRDSELIATQYRRLALLLNPSKNKLAFADEAFQLVSDAWSVLSNPSKKSLYDNELNLFSKLDPSTSIGSSRGQEHQEQQQHHNQQEQSIRRSARNSNVSNREKIVNEDSEMHNIYDEVSSFWTACPYCYNMYEYPRVYEECTLRCQNCRRAFHAVMIPSPPPISQGKESYFCCWGFFPLGLSMSNLGKNKGGGSNWAPFSPMFNCPRVGEGNVNVVEENVSATAKKPKNVSSQKSSAPRIYIDDDDEDFVQVLESSEDSDDDDWGSTRKKRKAKDVKGKGLAGRNVKKQQVEKGKSVKGGSSENLQGGSVMEEGMSVPNVSNIEVSKKAGSSSKRTGKVAKEMGKLDLNVEFSNEVEEPVPGMSEGHGAGNGEEDGIGFFEGLDEFLSSLPILSVVGDDKVKAT
ncbi:uncharacterized protein LOC132300250 [Cornus florida]|uniref:uncharacterized protein LOC132300250 n=1 Tax=Cornus florida TaxID=4283 RepID=UPI00289E6EF4|nr:uncharacterized protein LOC132300250 [Cornus florida]